MEPIIKGSDDMGPLHRTFVIAIQLALISGLAAGPALAHHAMGGVTPTTLWQGLVSGLAHPVIGPDHLAFILVAGGVSALAPGGLRLAACFIAASMAGVLLHVAELGLPMVEPAVAASVLVAGLLLVSGVNLGGVSWAALMVVAGVLHGYAFGEAVVGAHTSVIGAYLVGLGLVQLGIAAMAMRAMTAVARSQALLPQRVRAAGYAASAVGCVLLLSAIVQA